MKIFHIVNKAEWSKAKQIGSYKPASLTQDGFIHCSRADQIILVANSFFKNQDNLIILRIDVSKITVNIKTEAPLEAPWSDVHYPHLYGELNLDSVESEIEFPCSEDGTFTLPDSLL
ncbi:MAG: DUF952 domain-containing protein [Bacteriovoracaceae bacterium]|jgi:uncharacterized protein (DUF952 family)|nr:DUF952 domain-containing protein [Bacteriovoracaceae bacterium]